MEKNQSSESSKITDFFHTSPGKDSDLAKLANILPTPETSPVKDKTSSSEKRSEDSQPKPCEIADIESCTAIQKSSTENELDKNTSSVTVLKVSSTEPKDDTSDCAKSEAPAPKITSSKVRNRRGKSKKSTANSSSNDSSADTKPRTSQKKKKDVAPAQNNHVLTDYFPVRRSGRKCVSNIKKEEESRIEDAVLNGREIGLKVVDFEGKGRGVIATQDFRRGGFVVEYAGDLIDLTAAKEREEKYAAEPDKFGCYMYYFTHKNKNYCVDATLESGRLGRLLNHSKKGNCHTRLTEVQGTPRLILVASRDIRSGEELLYDYGDRSKSSIDAHPWLKT